MTSRIFTMKSNGHLINGFYFAFLFFVFWGLTLFGYLIILLGTLDHVFGWGIDKAPFTNFIWFAVIAFFVCSIVLFALIKTHHWWISFLKIYFSQTKGRDLVFNEKTAFIAYKVFLTHEFYNHNNFKWDGAIYCEISYENIEAIIAETDKYIGNGKKLTSHIRINISEFSFSPIRIFKNEFKEDYILILEELLKRAQIDFTNNDPELSSDLKSKYSIGTT